MYPRVVEVKPIENYNLLLIFDNGERKQFDMKPYIGRGLFSDLEDENMFRTVKPSFDTIEWANSADLDPEVLYSNSVRL